MTTLTKPRWRHLSEEDIKGITVTMKSGDCFEIPLKDLARACQSQEKIETFARQVGTLMQRLGAWLIERATEIHRAHLTIEPDGIMFVVVRNDKAFNPDFEDALSYLDLEVAQNADLDMIRLRVLALPYTSEDTVASFLDSPRKWTWAGAD